MHLSDGDDEAAPRYGKRFRVALRVGYLIIDLIAIVVRRAILSLRVRVRAVRVVADNDFHRIPSRCSSRRVVDRSFLEKDELHALLFENDAYLVCATAPSGFAVSRKRYDNHPFPMYPRPQIPYLFLLFQYTTAPTEMHTRTNSATAITTCVDPTHTQTHS